VLRKNLGFIATGGCCCICSISGRMQRAPGGCCLCTHQMAPLCLWSWNYGGA